MSALDPEASTVLGVESKVDIAVVPVVAIRAVENSGIPGEETRALRNPPRDLGVRARELGRSVRQAHRRIVA